MSQELSPRIPPRTPVRSLMFIGDWDAVRPLLKGCNDAEQHSHNSTSLDSIATLTSSGPSLLYGSSNVEHSWNSEARDLILSHVPFVPSAHSSPLMQDAAPDRRSFDSSSSISHRLPQGSSSSGSLLPQRHSSSVPIHASPNSSVQGLGASGPLWMQLSKLAIAGNSASSTGSTGGGACGVVGSACGVISADDSNSSMIAVTPRTPISSSVEDLLEIVKTLPANEPIAPPLEKGLHNLDSSALAALLKQMSKAGHLKRAVELFDWLRSLDPEHELRRLCDLFPYTTMISQCGSQQLARAMDLATEMRTRGIAGNVHTYSALMNACIKSNDVDLAQAVFKQMLEEGVVPNLVTYNILADVYEKAGQWEQALSLLDDVEAHEIRADARTYNTVISACNKANKPEPALKVYERMQAAGIKPSLTTFTSLISVCSKSGMVDVAMKVFQDMGRRGCTQNFSAYSMLILACEKAGRWRLALDLFGRMSREGCKPSLLTYNSLLTVLWKSPEAPAEKVVDLFAQMQSEGCKPDIQTYVALFGAFERGSQWVAAVREHEKMRAQGIQPEAPIYNSLMELLYQSGVVSAQALAMQFWNAANRSGKFRIFFSGANGSQRFFAPSPSNTGAVCVTLLRWLAELKGKLVKPDGSLRVSGSVSLALLQK